MKKPIFVIIDGNAIIHRAYHALPPLTDPEGNVVHAVYGFSSMLLKVYADLKPDYLAVAFDVAGKTFRDEMYEDYKATREKADQDLYDQIPLVYDVVRAFDIPIYTKEGYEADDVIGTIVTKLEKNKDWKGHNMIVTGDMDLLQLVTDKTSVYALRKGITDVQTFDPAGVEKKYGFGPKLLIDYKGLRGDTSDNIPGVAGIGDKSAKELIEKVGTVEEIFNQLDALPDAGIAKRITNKLGGAEEIAQLSKELATIHCDVPDLSFSLKKTATHDIPVDEVAQLFRGFGFNSLIKRIPGGEKITKKLKGKRKKKKSLPTKQYSSANYKELVERIEKNTMVSMQYTLSQPKDFHAAMVTELVIVVEDTINVLAFSKNDQKTKEILEFIFAVSKTTFVGYDIKPLFRVLTRDGIRLPAVFFDCMVAAYIVDPSARTYDIASVLQRELAQQLSSDVNQNTLFEQDTERIAEEVSHLFDLHEHLQMKMQSDKSIDLFNEIEMPLIPVLAAMEVAGILLDINQLDELRKTIDSEIRSLTKRIHKEAGKEFNIASSVQLRDILFEDLELPTHGIRKGKTGYSTAASELKKLEEYHPIIKDIESFREVTKLKNTYIDVLPTLVNKKTGRIHTDFNQTVAATGRLSSQDPNLQNIPIRTDYGKQVRNAFVAPRGKRLISADYSQIELRVVASLAKDKTMMEIFTSGEDIHTATAAKVFDVPLQDVDASMRRKAKEVNFGVLYGMGVFGLAERTGISHGEAREFINKYFESFAGVKEYLDKTLADAKENGYVETLFGRRRYVPELQSSNQQIRRSGERIAINMPIQGTAADLMKIAMIRVYNNFQDTFDSADVRLLLQVHDELVVEAPTDIVDDVTQTMIREMEIAISLDVPVVVHAAQGTHWGDIK